MPSTPVVPNRSARQYVRNREEFRNRTREPSLYAVDHGPIYVVYSYGPHWPLFIYNKETRVWVENTDRYSVTTSRHRSQAHPHPLGVLEPSNTEAMKWLINFATSSNYCPGD